MEPGLGAGVEHAGAARIGPDHPGEVVGRDREVAGAGARAGDRPPCLAVVGGPVEVGGGIVELVAGGGEVERAGRVRRGLDGADERPLGQIRRRHVAPAPPPVAAQVHQAVVRPRPQHARLVGRLGERVQGAVMLRPARVQGDRPARGAELVGRRAGEVGADRLPALPFVGAAEHPVAARVEHVRIVRREEDREGPSEAVPELPRPHAAVVLRPDVDQPDLAGAVIVALQRPAAARRAADRADVDDVRVPRVHRHVAALPGAGHAAVRPGDGAVVGARRHPDAGVVLLGAVDEVVGRAAVRVHGVELRGELVVDGAPRGAGVEGDVGPAVVALDHAPVVARVDPQIVVVAVRGRERGEVGARVGRFPHPEVVDVDAVLVLRVREDVHVVPGAVAQLLAVAGQRPGLAEVLGAVEAGRRVRLHQRPHPAVAGGRRGDADLAEDGGGGQAEVRGDLRPGRASVGGAPQAAAGAAARELPEVAVHPPQARVEDGGVAGVEGEVRRPRMLVQVQHPLPVRPPVGGAVHAALRVGAEGVPERGHVHAVRVARVDADLADVSGVGEAEMRPAPAAVGGLVNPVAVGDVGPDGALAHSRVDHARVGVRDRERAHRGRLQVPVAHVLPGGARVLGLPDAAGHRPEVEHRGFGRVAGHRHHPPPARRADAAEAHGVEQLVEPGRSCGRCRHRVFPGRGWKVEMRPGAIRSGTGRGAGACADRGSDSGRVQETQVSGFMTPWIRRWIPAPTFARTCFRGNDVIRVRYVTLTTTVIPAEAGIHCGQRIPKLEKKDGVPFGSSGFERDRSRNGLGPDSGRGRTDPDGPDRTQVLPPAGLESARPTCANAASSTNQVARKPRHSSVKLPNL